MAHISKHWHHIGSQYGGLEVFSKGIFNCFSLPSPSIRASTSVFLVRDLIDSKPRIRWIIARRYKRRAREKKGNLCLPTGSNSIRHSTVFSCLDPESWYQYVYAHNQSLVTTLYTMLTHIHVHVNCEVNTFTRSLSFIFRVESWGWHKFRVSCLLSYMYTQVPAIIVKRYHVIGFNPFLASDIHTCCSGLKIKKQDPPTLQLLDRLCSWPMPLHH